MFALVLSALAWFGAHEYMHSHRDADAALLSGNLDLAREHFMRCLELSPRNATVAYGLACTESRAGHSNAALNWLDRSVEWGYADWTVAEWDTDLDGLREEEAFAEAVQRMRAMRGASADGFHVRIVASSLRTSVNYNGILLKIVDAERQEQVLYERVVQWDAAIDPSGCFAAVANDHGVVTLLDASTGRAIRSLSAGDTPAWNVAFHPHRPLLVVLSWNGDLHWWDFDEGLLLRTVRALPREDSAHTPGWRFGSRLEFDPTGERLFVAGRERGSTLWSADGEFVRVWHEPLGGYFAISTSWGPGGRHLLVADDAKLRILDGSTGKEREHPWHTPSSITCLDMSPDGRHLATGHFDATVTLWDFETGRILGVDDFEALFDRSRCWISDVRFSPDGSLLAYLTGDGVDLVVLDVRERKKVFSDYGPGGRSGATLSITWSANSERLWYAFTGGVMPIVQVDMDAPDDPSSLGYGATPELSDQGTGIVLLRSGVGAVDANTGRPLWYRPALEQQILQSPSGHFASIPERLEILAIVADQEGEQRVQPLNRNVRRLFDPKRVRAARDGVELEETLLR